MAIENQPINNSNWYFSRRSFIRGGLVGALSSLGAQQALGINLANQIGIAFAANSKGLSRGQIGPMNPNGVPGLGPGGSLLGPNSRPFEKVSAGEDMIPQIEHIVVIMMENHSYDDHLGMLTKGDGFTLGPDSRPLNYNPDPKGGFVRTFNFPTTYIPNDVGTSQSWTASHVAWDHGKNDGFVRACGPGAMGYWDSRNLPFYYGMAETFPVGDRYFCSVMAQTYPNRRFLIAATAYGDIDTDISGIAFSNFPNGTIFDRLDSYNISWTDYYYDLPTCALVIPVFERAQKTGNLAHIEQFLKDCESGSLPSFSLIDPPATEMGSEEKGDIAIGEGYVAMVVNALMGSPLWPKSLLVWCYDEHGGFYDHVPPAPCVLPDNVPPNYTRDGPNAPKGGYDHTGFRVPNSVISPYSKKNYVSHLIYDHTSILKLIETKWNLPAMTYRDANANNMLDFVDFSSKYPNFLEPPNLPAPTNPFQGTPYTRLLPKELSQVLPKEALLRTISKQDKRMIQNHARKHSYSLF